MADWDDVARIALALPGTETFLRERPLHRRDLDELGADAPDGPVMVTSVPDEGANAAPLAAEPDVCFTMSHVNGWAAALRRLDETSLTELAGEAWAARAPRRLVDEHHLRTGA